MTIPAPQLVTWDHAEQIDISDLATAVSEVSGGAVHLQEISTGDDQYAVTISAMPLPDDLRERIYRRHLEGGDR